MDILIAVISADRAVEIQALEELILFSPLPHSFSIQLDFVHIWSLWFERHFFVEDCPSLIFKISHHSYQGQHFIGCLLMSFIILFVYKNMLILLLLFPCWEDCGFDSFLLRLFFWVSRMCCNRAEGKISSSGQTLSSMSEKSYFGTPTELPVDFHSYIC